MSPLRPVLVLVLALAAALAGTAHAEKADRDKPVNIEADRMLADDAKQTVEFEGRVVMTQGTFTLRADRITVRQDKDGFQFGVAVGSPATFREKRDGADEWIEGQAKRIEYDGRAQRVELFDQARVARDKDEVRGNYISYDQRGEVYRVQGAKDTQAQPARDERVRAVIQPKKRDEGAARRDAPLELKGTPGLDSPRQ
jgi:lipopolysaccharide export system protein LptA